jgi:hypothetical protein
LRAGHIPTAVENVQLHGTISTIRQGQKRRKEGKKDIKEKLRKKVREKERLFIKCSYLTSAVHHPFTLTIHLLIFLRLPLRLRSTQDLNPP